MVIRAPKPSSSQPPPPPPAVLPPPSPVHKKRRLPYPVQPPIRGKVKKVGEAVGNTKRASLSFQKTYKPSPRESVFSNMVSKIMGTPHHQKTRLTPSLHRVLVKKPFLKREANFGGARNSKVIHQGVIGKRVIGQNRLKKTAPRKPSSSSSIVPPPPPPAPMVLGLKSKPISAPAPIYIQPSTMIAPPPPPSGTL